MSYRLSRASEKVVSLVQKLPASKQVGSIKLCFDEKENGLAHLILDQPSRRNALTGNMMLDLVSHIKTLSNWKEGRAVIIRGSGNNFCAGADLTFASVINTPETGLLMHDLMSTALDELRDLPLLSVAAVEGAAVGGGAEFITACDWRVFGIGSKVHFVQTAMGIRLSINIHYHCKCNLNLKTYHSVSVPVGEGLGD